MANVETKNGNRQREVVMYLEKQRTNLLVQKIREQKIDGDIGELFSEILRSPKIQDICLRALFFHIKNPKTGENEGRILWTERRSSDSENEETGEHLAHTYMAEHYKEAKQDQETNLDNFLNTIYMHKIHFFGKEKGVVMISLTLSGRNLVKSLLEAILERAGPTPVYMTLNVNVENPKGSRLIMENIYIARGGKMTVKRETFPDHNDFPDDSKTLFLKRDGTSDVLEELLTRIYTPTNPVEP